MKTVSEKKKKNKLIVWLCVCAGIVLVCAAAFFSYKKGVELFLRSQIEKFWAENNFKLETISFDPWTSTVSLNKMSWDNPHQYEKRKGVVTVEEVSADLNVFALWNHVVHFEDVRVREVAFNLEFRKDFTNLADITSIPFDGPGVNVLEALIPQKPKKRPEAAADASKSGKNVSGKVSGVWYYRIDHLKITGTRVKFARLQKLDQMVNTAAVTLLGTLIPQEWMDSVGNILINLMVKEISGKVEFFTKGFTLPEYEIKNIGQNNRSTLSDVAKEIANLHLGEVKQYIENKKNASIGEIKTKFESLKKTYEKFVKKRKGKASKEQPPAEISAPVPSPSPAQ